MGQKTNDHQDGIRYFTAILGVGSAKVVLYTLSSNPGHPQTQPLCQSISSGCGLRVGATVLMKVETGHPKAPLKGRPASLALKPQASRWGQTTGGKAGGSPTVL